MVVVEKLVEVVVVEIIELPHGHLLLQPTVKGITLLAILFIE